MPQFTKSIVGQGTANAIHDTIIQDIDAEDLNLIFESVSGNFPAGPLNAVVSVSIDGTNYHDIDTAIALTAGQAKVVKYYNSANRGTTLALNPVSFPYIRVRIPALGGSVIGKLTYSGKKRFY